MWFFKIGKSYVILLILKKAQKKIKKKKRKNTIIDAAEFKHIDIGSNFMQVKFKTHRK